MHQYLLNPNYDIATKIQAQGKIDNVILGSSDCMEALNKSCINNFTCMPFII